MRVLIYIEPHPIRDSMVTQLHVAHYFARMFEEAGPRPDDCDYRLYSNDDILAAIMSKFPRVKDICLMPTTAEQALFQRNLVPWLERGMQEWIAVANGEGIDNQYYEVLAGIYTRFPFDVIVHWGANSAIARFCDDNGLGRLAMELGCTRDPYLSTIVFDPNGVSGSASPSLVNFADIREAVEGMGSSAELDLMTFSEPGGKNLYETRFDYDATLDEQIIGMAAGRPIAFLPLQVHDDENLLLYSKFSDAFDVVNNMLPQLTEAGYFCFVKPHPEMLTHPGGSTELFRVRQAVHKSPNAFCIDSQVAASANIRLIELADVVVTVNGSAGFEAALHNKPVCVLGEAAYKPGDVFPTLDDVRLQRIFEQDFAAHYWGKIGILRKFFLDSYLVPQRAAFELVTFTDRVRHLSRLKGSPAETVQSIYRQFGSAGRQERLAHLNNETPRFASTSENREQDKLLVDVQARVTALISSSSWRVTRPLRIINAQVRGVPDMDPPLPKTVVEGIQAIESTMSSASWAFSWPLRFCKAVVSSFRNRLGV